MELNKRNVLFWEVGKKAYDAYRDLEKEYDKEVLTDTSIETLRYMVARATGVRADVDGMIRRVCEESSTADIEWLQRATAWSNIKYEACVQHLRATREFVILMYDL